MTEIWKILEGFDNKYSISSLGNIRRNAYVYTRFHKGKLIKVPIPDKSLGGSKLSQKGYKRVNLDKVYFVHQLVAKVFIPNPLNKPQINHIDGNKLNNCIDNLERVTNQENRDHAVRLNLHPNRLNGFCKYGVTEVLQMECLYKAGYKQKQIAAKFNSNQRTVSKCLLWLKNARLCGSAL